MEHILLVDFGSTLTKVTAVDGETGDILGRAQSGTTVESDIGDGLKSALESLHTAIGTRDYARRYACSSAAGGLRMAVAGLVPELTAEAARLASLGAGAKVVKVYSFELTDEDIEELAALRPDIFLLTGGTDGGNSACILHNAAMLASCPADFPILIAGNRSVSAKCEALLAGRNVKRLPNVMPKLGELNIEPVQHEIRTLFLERIIGAKGLSRQRELISGILMPTPAAVLTALTLLADGTEGERGIGDLVAVDLGGATTDVYSVAAGMPRSDNTVMKGLPEPRVKRTVEGDIGMRWSATGVLEAAGARRLSELSGLPEDEVSRLTDLVSSETATLPDTPELEAFDFALASAAVETAVRRHAGTLEEVFTPVGQTFVQTGKDLRDVPRVIATGGALIHAARGAEAARFAGYSPADPFSLRPEKADVLVDRHYILSAMGLLAAENPALALHILKKEFPTDGTKK